MAGIPTAGRPRMARSHLRMASGSSADGSGRSSYSGARTVVEFPIVVQRQVPLVTVQKPVDFPQVQFLDRFVGLPNVEAPLVLTVRKPVEIQRVQIWGKLLQ